MAPLFTAWRPAYHVLPTASTIQAGLASFTSTPAGETISLQASATRAQDLRAFLTWAIRTGTAQLAQVNFQPCSCCPGPKSQRSRVGPDGSR
jgi:hypothetical protein